MARCGCKRGCCQHAMRSCCAWPRTWVRVCATTPSPGSCPCGSPGPRPETRPASAPTVASTCPGGDVSPDPASGRRTDRRAPDVAAGGAATGAGAVVPLGSPDAIEYAVANQLESSNLQHGVGRRRLGGPGDNPTADLNNHTDNPFSTIDVAQISTLQIPSLVVDAGAQKHPDRPHSGAPVSLVEPRPAVGTDSMRTTTRR